MPSLNDEADLFALEGEISNIRTMLRLGLCTQSQDRMLRLRLAIYEAKRAVTCKRMGLTP